MPSRTINILCLGVILGLCSLLSSCYYDVAEELYPNELCDTSNVTYSITVQGIFENKGCISCHNSNGTPSGGIILNQYDQVKIVVDNGRLMGAIRHENGYIAMPQLQDKIPQCDIDRINAWINVGAPNN